MPRFKLNLNLFGIAWNAIVRYYEERQFFVDVVARALICSYARLFSTDMRERRPSVHWVTQLQISFVSASHIRVYFRICRTGRITMRMCPMLISVTTCLSKLFCAVPFLLRIYDSSSHFFYLFIVRTLLFNVCLFLHFFFFFFLFVFLIFIYFSKICLFFSVVHSLLFLVFYNLISSICHNNSPNKKLSVKPTKLFTLSFHSWKMSSKKNVVYLCRLQFRFILHKLCLLWL